MSATKASKPARMSGGRGVLEQDLAIANDDDVGVGDAQLERREAFEDGALLVGYRERSGNANRRQPMLQFELRHDQKPGRKCRAAAGRALGGELAGHEAGGRR
jgi:hypothetical protein